MSGFCLPDCVVDVEILTTEGFTFFNIGARLGNGRPSLSTLGSAAQLPLEEKANNITSRGKRLKNTFIKLSKYEKIGFVVATLAAALIQLSITSAQCRLKRSELIRTVFSHFYP
jgi:hypothetical protein